MLEKQDHTIDISHEVLLDALSDNREIEFQLDNHNYLAAPHTDPPLPQRYGILDAAKRKWIFEGTIDELLTFRFPRGYTLNDDLERFTILFIL